MPEIFGSASYYGIGKILKQYSNFPVHLPLPVNVQHGIVGMRVSKHDALQNAPENWYWDKETFKAHLNFFPEIKGRTVGAPFLYLLRYLNYSRLPQSERSGTMVFPSHSSALIKVSSDFESFADQLSELPEKFHPITVCAYHIDFERGDYQPFIDRGYEIVTNGSSLYDTTFLYNFISNVKDKKFAISNSNSSSLYFSNALGVMAFQLGPDPDIDHKDPNITGIALSKEEQYGLGGFQEYFAFPNANYEVQHKLVAHLLGQDYLLSPRELKRLLWRNAFTIKYVVTMIKSVALFFLIPLKNFLRIPSFWRSKKDL